MILFQILLERNFLPLLPTYFVFHSLELLLIHLFSLFDFRKDDLFKHWKENQRCIEWFLDLI